MDKQINYNLEQGKSSLEDLKLLVDSSCQLFVDQVIHHINELRYYLLKNESLKLKDLSGVNSLLEWRIQQSLRDLLVDHEGIVQLNFNKHGSDISIESWNKILDCLPQIIELIKLFSFNSTLNISFKNNFLEISGGLKEIKEDNEFKAQIYLITRKLLSAKIILTYEILKFEDNKEQLLLRVDLSHNDNLIYLIEFNNNGPIQIGFTNCFENYILPENLKETLSKHICLELTEDLNIQKLNEIPSRILQGSKGGSNPPTIIHFPFLFRPFSLIIPNRGHVTNALSLRANINTGRGIQVKHGRAKDTNQSRPIFIEFDFFKLAS